MADLGIFGIQTIKKGGGGGPAQVGVHVARLPPLTVAPGPPTYVDKAHFSGPMMLSPLSNL